MSRLGKKPINITKDVKVNIENNIITIKGPKGELKRTLVDKIKIEVIDNEIYVKRTDESKISNMNQGLMRSLINNMVIGVTQGFKKQLQLVAREYKAQLQGKDLSLSLGYSHPVIVKAEKDITFEVPEQKTIIVSGIDNERVGQIAANIRHKRKWEPYTSKGIKYKDEKVRKKERKTGV